MEKDEAARYLRIAKTHYGTRDYEAAVRFAKKSIKLIPADDARAFLVKAEAALKEASTCENRTDISTTATDTAADNKPEISQDVLDILSCGTDYYKLLNLNKKFTENELKKSYRKLALKFHPDKNSTPGADEAFRLISRAFTVLSDPTKKILYDVNGDTSYTPAYSSEAFVGTDLRNSTTVRQPQKKVYHWSFVWKVSPIIALLAYSVFSGVFSKDAPVFSAI